MRGLRRRGRKNPVRATSLVTAAGLLPILLLAVACGDDDRMPTEIAPPVNSNATFSRVQQANSYLVRKITPGASIAGAPMPFGATITESDRQLVRDWVARGAPRD